MTSEAWLDKTSVVHFGTQWNFPVSPKSAAQSQPSIIPKVDTGVFHHPLASPTNTLTITHI